MYVRVWCRWESWYRERTEEDMALNLLGHQWSVCMEQTWIPSMSPDMTKPPGHAVPLISRNLRMDRRVLWWTDPERSRRMRTFCWYSSMSLFSNGHKGSLCGVCGFESRLVRISEAVLGKMERQLCYKQHFQEFEKEKRVVIPVVICLWLWTFSWL